MVFCSGVLFLVLSVTGLRQRIFEAVPLELKVAISCGIGLFIMFIGLKNGGLIASDPVTLVKAGRSQNQRRFSCCSAFYSRAGLICWKVRGAIILSVLALTLIGLYVPTSDEAGMLTKAPVTIHRHTGLAHADVPGTGSRSTFSIIFGKRFR